MLNSAVRIWVGTCKHQPVKCTPRHACHQLSYKRAAAKSRNGKHRALADAVIPDAQHSHILAPENRGSSQSVTDSPGRLCLQLDSPFSLSSTVFGTVFYKKRPSPDQLYHVPRDGLNLFESGPCFQRTVHSRTFSTLYTNDSRFTQSRPSSFPKTIRFLCI